jgi:4-amino-4-deoxy-L-arabinose transferase-like glycosyltransferase
MSATPESRKSRVADLALAPRLLRYALFALACLFLLVYIVIALTRMRYPFELEWMEGGSLDQVRRILAGQTLYAAPSLEFTAFIYPPLYFYLAAALATVTGLDFFPLRLLSFLASLGAFALIFLIVKEETRNRFAGFVSACLFAATFRLSGAWFDLGRTDSLLMFFLLLTLYLIKCKPSPAHLVLAGIAAACAFHCKQSALAINAALMIGALLLYGRRALPFIVSALLVTGISFAWLNYWTDGWAWFYLFTLPARHGISDKMIIAFWTRDLLARFWVACLASAYCLLTKLAKGRKRVALFYLLVSGAMVAVSWVGRLNSGGYANALFPAYAILAILFGLALSRALEFAQDMPPDRKIGLESLILLLCIAQFALLRYNPYHQVPTARDLAAGNQLLEIIRQAPGEVLIPYHNYMLFRAGKPVHTHWISIGELIGTTGGPVLETGAMVLGQMRQKIERQEYSLLILDEKWDVEGYYTKWRPAFEDPNVFFPVTGWRIRPETIFVPRRE